MRKALAALAISAVLSLFSGPAFAQTEYGGTGESLTVSDSRVVPGQTLTITGDGAQPGATVSIILGGDVVATTTAADDGTFTATFSIPGGIAPGTYTITAVSNGVVLASVSVVVPGSSGSGSGETSSLPFTGSSTLPGIGIGVTLIALGGAVLLASRRRTDRERDAVSS
jgi:PGF-CTERM protein